MLAAETTHACRSLCPAAGADPQSLRPARGRRSGRPALVIIRVPLSLVVLLTAAACDPDQVMGPPDPAKPSDAEGVRHEQAKHEQAKHDAADRFAVCMAGCIEGHAQSPTDRQTCRLTCGADHVEDSGPGPTPDTKAALGRFETCVDDGCDRSASATDAATCRLNCAQTALAGVDDVAALTGPSRACAVSCLEQVGECEAACTGGVDEKATCRLQCTSLGGRCLGACEADPSATPRIPAIPPRVHTKAAVDDDRTVSIPERTRATLPSPP